MTLKEDLIPILLKLFKNNSGEEGIIPSSFCKTSITLVLKSDTDTATKEKKKQKTLQTNSLDYNDAKVLNKILSN